MDFEKQNQDQRDNYFHENLLRGCAIKDILQEWENANGKLSDDELENIIRIADDIKFKQEQDAKFLERRQNWKKARMIPCKGCNKELHKSAHACPNCSATGKSKFIAAALASFFSSFVSPRVFSFSSQSFSR